MASVPVSSRRPPASVLGADGVAVAAALVATGVLVYAGLSGAATAVVAIAAVAVLAALVTLARHPLPAPTAGAGDDVTGLGGRDDLAAELDARLADPGPEPVLLLLFDLLGFKEYNDDFGREAGDSLLARLAEKLGAVAGPAGGIFRLAGDEFGLLAPVGEGDAERLIADATAALSMQGEGFRIECSFGGVLVPYEAGDTQTALRLAEARLAGQRRSRRRAHAMTALAEALSEGSGAGPLTRRVESLAVAVGGLLGLYGDRLQALARAAELHDIGELSIPSEILDKPGPLDESDWEFVRRQTLIAERIVRSTPQLAGIAPIVRATYENWDGSGHPDGRKGEDIPLAARIIRVCHAFDAMLSPRSYRPALSPEAALDELERLAGSIFDPAVVKVLAALVTARAEGLRAA
jgi:diguanylate cyclase (GGDEF)-like protein